MQPISTGRFLGRQAMVRKLGEHLGQVGRSDHAGRQLSAHHLGTRFLEQRRCAAFISAKRGLATTLHSGDPTFDTLPDYFQAWLLPALRNLLNAAAAAREARADADPNDLLGAIGRLGMRAGDESSAQTRRMTLLVDGMRYGAKP